MQASFKMEDYCSVSCLPIRLTMFLLLYSYVHGNLFEEVSSCPSNEEEWMDRAQIKGCQEPYLITRVPPLKTSQNGLGKYVPLLVLQAKVINLHRLKPH